MYCANIIKLLYPLKSHEKVPGWLEQCSNENLSEFTITMTEPNVMPTEETTVPPNAVDAEGKVTLAQWALAILLTILIGLSAAALLSASVMELMFDSPSAWIRIGVLLPVLLIASYLLVQLWRKLFNRHDAAKK